MNQKISADELREILRYEPETGLFIWRKTRCSRALANQVAGFDSDGYIGIRIHKVRYLAHRLAWLYMTGKWPVADVDHINGAKADNRWMNLRSATRTQNNANSRMQSNNKAGFKGVSLCACTGRWKAQLRCNGVNKTLGRFDTPEEAHQAYADEAKRVFGEFAKTG